MDKAIEIKRRAQRCILNGDLDGALVEYERLVAAPDADPYHSVLLADLLYKKGDHPDAGERYFNAVDGYEQAGLYKNAIAVCKKMARLTIAPARVLQKLATLHKLEGLTTEASLYFMQHAEQMVRDELYDGAIDSLRQGFDASPDNVKALERLAEVQILAEKSDDAAKTLLEAADVYNRLGQFADAVRCQDRAGAIDGNSVEPSSDDVEHGSSLTPDTSTASDPVASSEPSADDSSFFDPNDQTAALTSPGAVTVDEDGPSAPPDFDIDAGSELVAGDEGDDSEAATAEASESELGTTPAAPGLQFESPAGVAPAPPPAPAPAMPVAETTPAEEPREAAPDPKAAPATPQNEPHAAIDPGGPSGSIGIQEIGQLLNDAQNFYARGERDAAGATLVTAARAYDDLGHHDSAAAIYRGLHDARQASTQVMVMWLQNCKTRGDRSEASRVACEIGDQTMNDGDAAGAKEWFERAHMYDQDNPTATTRLERLAGLEASAVATAEVTDPEAAEPNAAAALPDADPAIESDDAGEADSLNGAPAAEIEASSESATPDLDADQGTDHSTDADTEPVSASPPAAEPQPAAPAEAETTEPQPGTELDTEPGTEPDSVLPADWPPVREGHELAGSTEAVASPTPGPLAEAPVPDRGPDTELGDEGPPDLGWLIGQFQRGVAEQLANDCRAHYDLGVSYREMGLLEEAITSFREAACDHTLVPVSTEMIVRCMLDQGRLDEAVNELRTVLAEQRLETDATVSLNYQLGLALEAGGRQEEALMAFERVSADAPDYADVERKVRDLRVALGRS